MQHAREEDYVDSPAILIVEAVANLEAHAIFEASYGSPTVLP